MEYENNKVDMSVCEKNIFDFTHEEVGSYILDMWQLPYPIVETALRHSDPSLASKHNKALIYIVNLADHYSWKLICPQFMSNVSSEIYNYLGITKLECESIADKYREGEFKL